MNRRLGLLWIVIAIFILTSIFLIFPVKQVLTFQETRVEKPITYYSLFKNGTEFQIRYTHSIHLSDVIESYAVTDEGEIQLVSMSYEHLSVGMPGYAEEGQSIDLKDGRYILSFEDEVLPQFILYIGDIDLALELIQNGKNINLKEQLKRGKSYIIQAKKLSLYEMMKGVKMYGKATGESKPNEVTFDQLTAAEQQAILEKFDIESNMRNITGIMKKVIFLGLLAFSLFQLYTAIYGQFPGQIQRTIHLGFGLSIIFLLYPARRKGLKTTIPFYDYILSLLAVGTGLYWTINYNVLVKQLTITQVDFIVGLIVTLLVIEAARRAVGLPITIIALLFLVYAYFGQHLPGFLAHRGQSLESIVNLMFYTTDGILGTPISVSATYIFIFLLFGAFLVKTGVGQYFNDLAVAFAGKLVGGPAKVAIFSSALQGTISGSSVANVVTSGSYTIPMMKKLGYRKEFAGAVEASASTGGQLMPPIMGAAAFLMVEFIGRGITYWDIAKAAAIPALLYFMGIWIMTHFEAKRLGLSGLTDDQMPNRLEVLKKIYLLIPILAIIALMLVGVPVLHSALYGVVLCIVVGMFNKDTRLGIRGIIEALVDGARTALSVVAATACAGIIVGVVVKTGLGLSLANSLVELAGGSILLTLFFVMIASLILGMGAPTTANYVITSTIAAPAIITLLAPNVPIEAVPIVVILSAHFFVFYFGIIADITPPVALAAFSAAAISGGDPIKTGIESAKLAIAAFIIPYMIVYSPALLMIDTTILQTLWVVFTAMVGMVAIGAGVIGFWYRKMFWFERIPVIIAGLLCIYPEKFSDWVGLAIFITLFVIQYLTQHKFGGGNLEKQIT